MQHKSELGGVVLGLVGADERPGARLRRWRRSPLCTAGVVLAERMAAPGVELIVAAHDDGIVPAWCSGWAGSGPSCCEDVVVVPLPADHARVRAALTELRGAPLLQGARGGEAVDLDAVAALAVGVGRLLVDRGLSVIECNPVLAGCGWRGRRRRGGARWSRDD